MRKTTIAIASILLSGCTSTSLNTALGTPKNPTPILSDPTVKRDRPNDEKLSKFISADYLVLLEAIHDKNSETPFVMRKMPADYDARRYIAAGFHLADMYCSNFFSKTDEAYRRRRFGRTLTNDVGTAISTLMGLANAGEKVVTGAAAAVGLADSAWRNYDDSFVISPELANVRSLVLAAQDNFRAKTLGKDVEIPRDFGTAQSAIQRYAELCSFLGMKALLDQSATEQRNALVREITPLVKQPTPVAAISGGDGAPTAAPAAGQPASAPPPAPIKEAPPATATPALISNTPS